MKDRKTRKLPIILSVASTVAATVMAVYYRRQNDVHNPNLLVLEPHPEQMRKIQDGSGVLRYWIDERGESHYTVSDRRNGTSED